MSNLPKIQQLYDDKLSVQKQDTLVTLLNQPPKKEWICQHPFIKKEIYKNGQKIKVPFEYLPIERVKFLLNSIFKRNRIIITGQGTAFNGVWVTVRVQYWNPVFNDWDFHDGIGALQLQTSKGTSPADLGNINNGALSMAFPHAKTLAIKDACDEFGKLFGSDLNRNDVITYELDLTLLPLTPEHPNWDKAKNALKEGKITIEQIRKTYEISDENFNLINE